MDSPPEAAKRASGSPSVQDSPFFSYISSLSPIKPVNSGNTSHGDLTVPSPQPVFTSPHTNLPGKVNLMRRSQRLSGSENFLPGFADDAAAYLEATETCGPSVSALVLPLIPCTQGHGNGDSSQDHYSSSHSSCVDEFLTDPVDDSDNLCASPAPCLKQAVELPQSTQGGNNSTFKELKQSDEEVHGVAQCCSPSASVEKVMAHAEGSTATDLPDTHVKRCTDLTKTIQGEYATLEESPMELHVSLSEKGTDSSASMNLKSSFQAEDLIGQGPSSLVNLVEAEASLKIFDNAIKVDEKSHREQREQVSNSINSHIDAALPSVRASGAQSGHVPADQIEHNKFSLMSKDSDIMDHGKASNSIPQVQPEAIQNIEESKNPHDNSGAKPNASAGNEMPYEQQECFQHQRCMRKRLQFEPAEVHGTSSGRDDNSWNFTAFSNAEPLETSLDLESPNFIHGESVGTSNNKKTTSGKVDMPVQTSGSLSSTVTRPCGIGLHLNSIGSAAPMACNTSLQCLEKDIMVKGKKSLSENQTLLDPKNSLASTSLKLCCSAKSTCSSKNPMHCSASRNSEEELQENQQVKLCTSSVDHQSLLDVKPLNISPHSKLIDCHVTPCTMKRPLEDSSMSEELSQTSPRKKRKKAPDNDGCKRCNCKRSKCLKLYCDCFAAGAYCTEDCACQECFNRPEHQDVVLGTRQQIESRNPLAFAPKVVIRVTESQKDSGDSKYITPTSARHKRGCNCKKSLCLKKYCECYQAGVGCSLGCRCEGCKNSFGRKNGFGDIAQLEHKILQKEIEHKKFMVGDRDVASSGGKLEQIEVRSETTNAEQCHSHLSPLTPLLQGSSEHDASSKSQFPVSYYPSPESNASLLPSFMESPSSPSILASYSTSRELREGCSSVLPYDQKPECHAAAKVDPFSPEWDGFFDVCNLNLLLEPSPAAAGSSASQAGEHKILQTKLFQGSGCILGGSLRWRCSPITPLPCFGEGKFAFEPASDSGQHNIAQDDTPDVLKDTLSPIKAVKATSPNQKRVSPPNKSLQESRSNISLGIKNGRKFILQSVPAFPPLTPYSNSTSGNGT